MTLHLERIAPPSRLLKSQLGRDEIPWRTDRNMLQGLSCLPRARLDRHQQSGLVLLLAGPLIVGYPPMMKFAANLPTRSMHIIRPQS